MYINQNTLKDALDKCVSIVGGNAVIPALAGVKIDAADCECAFETNNGTESVVVKKTTPPHEQEFHAVLPARLLSKIVNVLPKDSIISINVNESSCDISCGNIKYTLVTIAYNDFVSVYPHSKKIACEIPFLRFKEKAKYAISFCSQDYTRPILGAVHITCSENGDLRIKATDGYRIYNHDSIEANIGTYNFVCQAELLKTICRNHNEDCTLSVLEDKNIMITVGDTFYFAPQIDGNYPSFSQFYTLDDNTSNIEITDKEALISILRRCKVIDEQLVELTFNNATEELTVVSGYQGVGSYTETVSYVMMAHARDKDYVCLNTKLFIECLEAVDGNRVSFYLEEPGVKPLTIIGGDFDRTIIMPIRK